MVSSVPRCAANSNVTASECSLHWKFRAFTEAGGALDHGGDEWSVVFRSECAWAHGTVTDHGDGTYSVHALLPRGHVYRPELVLHFTCFQSLLEAKQRNASLFPQERGPLYARPIDLQPAVKGASLLPCSWSPAAAQHAAHGWWNLCPAHGSKVGALAEPANTWQWSPYACALPASRRRSRPEVRLLVGDSTLPGRQLEIGNPYPGNSYHGDKVKWGPVESEARWAAFLNQTAAAGSVPHVVGCNSGLHFVGKRATSQAHELQTQMLCDLANALPSSRFVWLSSVAVQDEIHVGDYGDDNEARVLALNTYTHHRWKSMDFNITAICAAANHSPPPMHTPTLLWGEMHPFGLAMAPMHRPHDKMHVGPDIFFFAQKSLVNYYMDVASAR